MSLKGACAKARGTNVPCGASRIFIGFLLGKQIHARIHDFARCREKQKSPRVRVISVRGETEADKYVLWGFLFSRHRPVYYFSYTVARKSLFPLCAAAGNTTFQLD
ncbi:unnamed protein product [Trichogramma brassicae]|uniref:Uncharacterized protein n=1 Tax=Trichogramma brassicae TaxID=86971 RepID=A0A6H5J5T7_9HYME|nr:unnamed protein product [Trichogramma brassicae]